MEAIKLFQVCTFGRLLTLKMLFLQLQQIVLLLPNQATANDFIFPVVETTLEIGCNDSDSIQYNDVDMALNRILYYTKHLWQFK